MVAVSASAQETRLLEPEDLFELRSVSNPAISPDGGWVAYTVRTKSLDDDSSETRVWMASTTDATVLPMTGAGSSAGSPQWSPDGRYIAHVSVTEPEIIWYATGHLAITPATGGPARVLSERLDRNVGSPRFSPDGGN